MSVFKAIPLEDQTITPFKVYKSWEYTSDPSVRYTPLISQSILLCTAIKPDKSKYSGNVMPLDFDEEVNKDYASYILNYSAKDVPTGVLWHSLKHMYFNNYEGSSAAHGAVPRYDIKIWKGNGFKSNNPIYYKSYEDVENTLNPSSSVELCSIASVISIPQIKCGEQIKPGTFELEVTSSIGSTTAQRQYILADDGYGNLIDTSVSSSVKLHNRIFYLGFNQSEYESDLIKTNLPDPRYPTFLDFYNVNPVTSFITTNAGNYYNSSGTPTTNNVYYGLAGYFSQSYVRVDHRGYFSPRRKDNYAVSFWFKLDSLTPGHGANSYLITKRALRRDYALFNNNRRTRQSGNVWNENSKIFPYDISVTSAGVLQARASDGINEVLLTKSGISTSAYYHCVFQKSGSAYQLWVDGTQQGSDVSSNRLANIKNESDIFIGSLGTKRNDQATPNKYMHGKIDEVQIFNTYLTPEEIKVLADDSTLNNNLLNRHGVGKIFYKQGLVVISNPNPKYGAKYSTRELEYDSYFPDIPFGSTLYNNGNTFNSDTDSSGLISTTSGTRLNTSGSFSNITLRWNSTLTLYENEILCRIREDEFNFTMNPSIFQDLENTSLPEEFVYNDEFGPYITTIGLYNEYAELLAIGKLASPIKKRANVDLNIIVRFDQ